MFAPLQRLLIQALRSERQRVFSVTSFLARILGVFLTVAAGAANAQEAVPSQLQISPSGEAYLDALGYRRIETDVIYFDPSAPPPALETNQEPQSEQSVDPSGRSDGVSIPNIALYSVIIAVIGYFFVRYGGRFSVSLRPQVANPARQRNASQSDAQATAAIPNSLNQILNMPDRNAALIVLAQAALAKTLTSNGLLVQQSWTRREALRQLPTEQSHLAALRSLVMTSERIQFGGQAVSGDEFDAHVDDIRPLLREVWA